MGKKQAEQHAQSEEQRQRAQAAADRQAAIAAREPLRQRIAARRKAIDKHDFDHAPDFIGNTNISAERNKVMENTANLKQTGIAGLANNYASADTVAMASKLLKDRMGQVTGGQWESDVGDYINGTNAQETDIANADAGMYSNFNAQAESYAAQNQQTWTKIAMQRASVLPSLLGAGLGAVGSMFSGRFGGSN